MIEGVTFQAIDWATVPSTEHPGETGRAIWRTVHAGAARVRMVEYSPGYRADHWCKRGHILLVLQGELVTGLESGQEVILGPGMGYHVGSNGEGHRSRTTTGATLFIVD